MAEETLTTETTATEPTGGSEKQIETPKEESSFDKFKKMSPEEQQAFITGETLDEPEPEEPEIKEPEVEKPEEAVKETETKEPEADPLMDILNSQHPDVQKILKEIGVRNASTLMDALKNYAAGDKEFSQTRQVQSDLEKELIRTGMGDSKGILNYLKSLPNAGEKQADKPELPFSTDSFDSWLGNMESQVKAMDEASKRDYELQLQRFNQGVIDEPPVYNPQFPIFEQQKAIEIGRKDALLNSVHSFYKPILQTLAGEIKSMQLPQLWESLPEKTKQTWTPFKDRIFDFVKNPDNKVFGEKNPFEKGIKAFAVTNDDAMEYFTNRSDVKADEKLADTIKKAKEKFSDTGAKGHKDIAKPTSGKPGKDATDAEIKAFTKQAYKKIAEELYSE